MKKTNFFFLFLIPLLLSTLLLPFNLNAQERFEQISDEVQVDDVLLDTTLDDTDQRDEDGKEIVIDEYTKKVTNRYFDLTLEREDQNAFNYRVGYVLTVKPHVNSARTQILWNIPTSIEVKPKHSEFNALNSGETYVFKGSIKPLKSGIYDFSISVISWQHDTNYTNSISDTLVFDKNLVLQPVSSHYKTTNILKFSLIGLVFVTLVVIVIMLGKNYSKKAKEWLTMPD